jgi:hypothetical protein
MADLPDIEDITTGWSNGISQNSKTWLPQSGRMLRNLEIFNDTDSVTLKPAPIKDSGTTVTGLVKWIESAYPYESADVRYAYDDSGNIYRIASNTWSLDHTVASGTPVGQGEVVLTDELFYATSTTIGRKFRLSSGSGTYNDDFFSDGTHNLDASVSASGQTYTPPVAISETAPNSVTYQPAFDPLVSIQLYVTAKGTGNWTITFHDSLNNNLGTATLNNAAITNGAMNTFVFTTPIRINIGVTYHFHVTSTVADGTLQTGTTADLSTAQYNTYFGILVSDSLYHPMKVFTNGVTGIFVVGNDHYLGTYDNLIYNPNKITLLPGYKVRALMTINNYIVAFCWRGSAIDSFEDGYAFYWDGIQPYYNFARPLTEGQPNAVENFKNRLLGIFGNIGNIEIAPDESNPFRKIQPAPKLTNGYRTETYPGAIGIWLSRALFGYANTNDPNAGAYNDPSAGAHVAGDTYTPPSGLEPGIYEFGNQSDRAITYTAVSTEVLTFSFTPSTTIVNPTDFQIGCIAPFGQDCYFAYKDGTNYYCDRVNKVNSACAFGSFDSLISDETFNKIEQFKQQPGKSKLGLKVRVTFAPLPTGCTVTAKWRRNRDAAWTFGQSVVAGADEAHAFIGGIAGKRYREIEYGFDITSTGGFPIITSIGLFYRPLPQEVAGKAL